MGRQGSHRRTFGRRGSFQAEQNRQTKPATYNYCGKIGHREECQRKRSESVSTSRQLTIYAANSDYDDYGGQFMMRHRANSMTASNSASTSRPSPKPDKGKGKVPEYEDDRCGYNEFTAHHYAFAMKEAAEQKLESPTEAARNPRWVEAVGLRQFRMASLYQRLEGESAEKPKSVEGPTRGTTRPKSRTVKNPKIQNWPEAEAGYPKPKPILRNRRQYRPEAEAGYPKAEADSTESKTKPTRSRSRLYKAEADSTESKTRNRPSEAEADSTESKTRNRLSVAEADSIESKIRRTPKAKAEADADAPELELEGEC